MNFIADSPYYGLVRGRLCVHVADERELREKFIHVLELTREGRELVQIFPAQFVIGEIYFRVIIVNRFHYRRDHLRWQIRFSAGRDLVERVRELGPMFFRFSAHVHRQ